MLALPEIAATPTREVTFLFCDIAQFTPLTELMGDVASYHFVRRCEQLAVSVAEELDGEVLEVRGDGFLFVFDSAVAAVACAGAIQRELARAKDLPIQVRVGLHTGPAIHDGRRYFGRNVIAAFRVSSLAQADEVLVSDATHRRLPSAAFAFEGCRSVELKGLAGREKIWMLDWREARGARPAAHRPPLATPPAARPVPVSAIAS